MNRLRTALWLKLLILTAVFGGLCANTASAAEPSRLRVLCYNIHYGQGTDGKYDLQRLATVILAETVTDTILHQLSQRSAE